MKNCSAKPRSRISVTDAYTLIEIETDTHVEAKSKERRKY